MLLYKYIAEDRIGLLATRRIRFTQPIYFNDPFEMAPRIEAAMDKSFQDRLVKEMLDAIRTNPRVGSEHYHDALKEHERATGLPLSRLFPYEEQLAAFLPPIPDFMQSLFALVNTQVAETFYTDLRDRVARMFGVLSLAEVPDSLLMWAHYSSEHRGAVIGFEKEHPFFDRRLHDQDVIRHVRPVAYSERRPKRAILYEPQDEARFLEELAHDFFLVKSPDWAYEREWRMILPAADAIDVVKDGKQEVLLYDFPAEAVREVIIGCRASEAIANEVRLTLRRPEYRHVTLRRARLHKELFQLVLEPDTIETAG